MRIEHDLVDEMSQRPPIRSAFRQIRLENHALDYEGRADSACSERRDRDLLESRENDYMRSKRAQRERKAGHIVI